MKKLNPTNLVIEWPRGKAIPAPGKKINAGDLGFGIVMAYESIRSSGEKFPRVLLEIAIFEPIGEVESLRA